MFFLFVEFIPLSQGSVAQLREVWEETDGLDPQEFNPKTFFKLHGEGLLSFIDVALNTAV